MLNLVFLVNPLLANLNRGKWSRAVIWAALLLAAGLVGVRLSSLGSPVFSLAVFDGEAFPRIISHDLEFNSSLLFVSLASLLVTFVKGVKLKAEYLRYAVFPLVSLGLEPAFILCYLLMSESLRLKPTLVSGAVGVLALTILGIGHAQTDASSTPLYLWSLLLLYLALLMRISLKPVDNKENLPVLDLWLSSFLIHSVLLELDSGSLVLMVAIGAILVSLPWLLKRKSLHRLLSMLIVLFSLLFFLQPQASSLYVVIASMFLVVVAEAVACSPSKKAVPCEIVESYLGVQFGIFSFLFCLLALLLEVHLGLMVAGAIVALLASRSLRSISFYLANSATSFQGWALRSSGVLMIGSFVINWLGLI